MSTEFWHTGSKPVSRWRGGLEELVAQSVNNALVRLGLAVPVAPRQMVEAGGVEPPS